MYKSTSSNEIIGVIGRIILIFLKKGFNVLPMKSLTTKLIIVC